MADYKAAKKAFDMHCVEHRCKAMACEVRKALWIASMKVAARL